MYGEVSLLTFNPQLPFQKQPLFHASVFLAAKIFSCMDMQQFIIIQLTDFRLISILLLKLMVNRFE